MRAYESRDCQEQGSSCSHPRRGAASLRLEPHSWKPLPLDDSLLPNQHAVTRFEEQGNDGRKEHCHDRERGIDFPVLGPTLRPAHIPAEARFHAYSFRHDKGEEGCPKSHEEADEDAWHGGGNRDAKNQILGPRAKSASHVEVRGARVGK